MSSTQLLSLFCGAGGLDLGFSQAGFDVNVAIDWSSAAIETHKFNFPDATALQHDLIELGVDGLLSLCKKHFNKEQSVGIIGGPPCQGFSRGNIKSTSQDPRNKLALLYIDFITALRKNYNVDFVVFENVMGLKYKKHINVYNKIICRLKSIGFDVFEHELNAVDFGVAQNRKRVIIIALRKGSYTISPSFYKTNEINKTVKDLIYNLPSPAYYNKKLLSENIPFHPNHWTMVPRAKRFTDPSLWLENSRSFRVIDWEKPSPTIAYGNREIYVHPNKSRRLSIYESMLLQGFPNHFVLKGNLSQQVTQVSNAVPPPMARKIAQIIKEIRE
ncbi:cytosine-specific methyltransferase [Serratia marcescens]|nr:cytosine-specific methyltransferase [Serratia marcescens]